MFCGGNEHLEMSVRAVAPVYGRVGWVPPLEVQTDVPNFADLGTLIGTKIYVQDQSQRIPCPGLGPGFDRIHGGSWPNVSSVETLAGGALPRSSSTLRTL